MFIPDPDLDFYPSRIPDKRTKRHRILDPEPQHWDLGAWIRILNNGTYIDAMVPDTVDGPASHLLVIRIRIVLFVL
jgi:hypothetical protein